MILLEYAILMFLVFLMGKLGLKMSKAETIFWGIFIGICLVLDLLFLAAAAENDDRSST